jgi:hypothetical protein
MVIYVFTTNSQQQSVESQCFQIEPGVQLECLLLLLLLLLQAPASERDS